MENKQNSKVLYILLSVLLAAVIWFVVDEYGNNGGPFLEEKTITEIPVEYRNENRIMDRGFMLQEEGNTATVDITFEGPRRLLSRLDRSKIEVTVDLSGVSYTGIQTASYKISYSDQRFNNLTRKSITPSLATINIGELHSKTVEVRCELTGNIAEGYSAGALQITPAEIEVRGEAADIEPVSYARVTLDIGEKAENTVSRTLVCNFYDRDGNLLDVSRLRPSTRSVEATLPLYVTKELKLEMEFEESSGLRSRNLNVQIQPETILVSGEASKLRGVESITLGKLELLEMFQSKANSYSYPIIIPDGCQNLSGVTRATAQLSFKDLTTARIPVTEITYSNLPKDKDVEILTNDLAITIYGTTANVSEVTEDNIVVIANLSDFSGASGTYTVPVKVTLLAAGDVGVSGTYEVRVKIQEPEPDPELDLVREAE